MAATTPSLHRALYGPPSASQAPSYASSSTTPRSTPSFAPQLYINTEHRPTVHRVDSYQPLRAAGAAGAIEPLELEPEMEVDDSDDDEVDHDKEENEDDYCYGGYHPVVIGEKFGTNKQYRVVRKLGWGHFSTVWLAYDEVYDRHVAIKIVRSRANYTQAALDEISILNVAIGTNPDHPGYEHLVKMYDWFYHEGPNGKHVCMVFEVLGQTTLGLMDECRKSRKSGSKEVVNLLTLEKSYGGLPLSIAKKISKQLLLVLDYLHRECGLIHTDIKPENILIEIRDVEKFVRCLKCCSKKSRSTSSIHSAKSRSSSASARCSQRAKDFITPVKCSKPLPSPLTASSNHNFKDYFSSNYSLTSSISPCAASESRSSRSQGSVSYYDNDAPHDPHSPSRPTSISNSTSPDQAQSLIISASEAPSDDEDEGDGDYCVTVGCNPRVENLDSSILQNLSDRLSTVSIDEDDIASLINIKLADLGNACFANHHYTNDIQTRQYRSPEILLGHRWGCSTDIWSVACVVFELITGDYLFDPKTGKHHNKDDDHIAQIIELLVVVNEPEKSKFMEFVSESAYARTFFHSDCFTMRNIKTMKYWPLHKVLEEKYHMEPQLARDITGFLLPMLHYNPHKRVDAGGWSNHPWLRDVKNCGSINREVGRRGDDINGWYRTHRPGMPQRNDLHSI